MTMCIGCFFFFPAASEGASNADSGSVVKQKPLKAMKMKRDPKKLRMGGGKVWEDHTLDDWDQGKGTSQDSYQLSSACFTFL